MRWFRQYTLPPPAPWLDLAEGELGTWEYQGAEDNPRVVAYHASTSTGPAPDAVPWCSSFVNWCMVGAGYRGTGDKLARSWLSYGRPIEELEPDIGSIVVLSRGTPPQGHVGFYVGAFGGQVLLLGGNQSNRVQVDAYPVARVLAYRWPPPRPTPLAPDKG